MYKRKFPVQIEMTRFIMWSMIDIVRYLTQRRTDIRKEKEWRYSWPEYVLRSLFSWARRWLSYDSSENRLDDALIKPSGQREIGSLPTTLDVPWNTENNDQSLLNSASIQPWVILFLFARALWTFSQALMLCTPSMSNMANYSQTCTVTITLLEAHLCH